MNTFRLATERIRDAVLPVIPDGSDTSDDALAARFAAGVWTVLPEPGDAIAGAVREALGDGEALELLISGATAGEWHDKIGDLNVAKGISAALQRWAPRLAPERMLLAFSQGAKWGQRLLTPADSQWPSGLDDLGPHAPSALWVRGRVDALAATRRSAALVGSRASSGYGEIVAAKLAGGVAERGIAVISGGAFGIDGTAHRATLSSSGVTIAVLAGGLDRFYPTGNDELLGRVAQTACVVAEAPSGTPPTRWRFLARNRLIAAVSSATVVVEAGARSGSINTAGHAATIGRPLGAVPGPVTTGASAGCHRLLRDYAAVPIERAADVVELIDGPEASVPSTLYAASAEEERVFDALSSRAARGLTELAVRTGLGPGEVASSLALLELGERVTERAGGWVRAA